MTQSIRRSPSLWAMLWRLANAQLLRYLAASLLALALDLSLFSLGLRVFSWPWWLSATISFAGGAVLAYLCSITWVFGERRLERRGAVEFTSFVAIGVAGLALTQAALFVGIEVLHHVPEHVRLMASIVTFLFNYLLRSILLFKRKHVA
ncbi:GtrA family protein [Pseudoxanthomonas spadix]|uniref:GtrA family protein n=1 Tax=Pseudoxanthomonas spadix TaxID=415229 RepID=UPI001472B1DF|nr:GtrA family protein [Pseudoxanthomonas spadix]MBP3973606.1 GtrA family protein [Pseudoxanthomonas spadix]